MIDWELFKATKIAIKCTTEKERFFSECAKREIYNFLSDRAVERNIFICRLCYKDQFSEGRYELLSLDKWQTRPGMLFGKEGLSVIAYDNQ